MIERIVIENFKSLRSVDLALGRVNLFIGTNASGKSNFLEALRVLEGIGNGFTIGEVLNGKPGSISSEVWQGLRGGSAYACFAGADGMRNITITANGMHEKPSSSSWKYHIVFSPSGEGSVVDEKITMGSIQFGSSDFDRFLDSFNLPKLPKPILGTFHDVDLNDSSTGNIISTRSPVAKLLSNAQRIDPMPLTLRGYSQHDQVDRMGLRGENFAALVKTICQDEKTKDAYLSWLRHLRPEEVDDVGALSGALGEPMFMLRENGRDFPAPVLSDGTLRFAALTAAFFQPDMPDIMTIEEVENGIHASRVQLLLDLFRTQAEATKTQVFATTHSPAILDWLQDDDYKTTFLCTRNESTGETKICPLVDIPQFMNVSKKTPASELFSEGWFEAVS